MKIYFIEGCTKFITLVTIFERFSLNEVFFENVAFTSIHALM